MVYSIIKKSQLEGASWIDAEYFQEKYKKLIKKIKLNSAEKLGDLAVIKKGFEPGAEEYKEEGKLFIRVSSLSANGIESSEQKYLSDKLYEELKNNYEPKVGEILLTKDATPGIAYAVKEPVQGIMSSGILRLKISPSASSGQGNIDAEYLTLCLNSIIGKMQAERDAGGSVIAHWKPEQIKNIIIPILPKTTQQKIADLVRQSHEARKKAKELIEEAKKKVEKMIEEGEK
ncbi:MAG: restriction endonuclease subunit S [Parcubacteria group bacterium]|nr:restriction endonuclease subunit S [Parcubacteria group bacterium]